MLSHLDSVVKILEATWYENINYKPVWELQNLTAENLIL